MGWQIRAKMRVNFVGNPGWGGDEREQVNLAAVYSSDPNSENYSYSQATPQANLSMVISNPEAKGFFEPNAEYIVTFEKAQPATT